MLGVAPSASRTEIKAAYRALVKQHHPDAGGDQQMILALAMNTLEATAAGGRVTVTARPDASEPGVVVEVHDRGHRDVVAGGGEPGAGRIAEMRAKARPFPAGLRALIVRLYETISISRQPAQRPS